MSMEFSLGNYIPLAMAFAKLNQAYLSPRQSDLSFIRILVPFSNFRKSPGGFVDNFDYLINVI